jgi:hypothetical protein
MIRTKETPGILLEKPQHDTDHGIALNIGAVTGLQENIRLINQHQGIGISSLTQFQNGTQRLFDFGRCNIQIQQFRNGFSSEPLFASRWTMEKEDGIPRYIL